eukprot:487341-Amphidinium_carterae.1
MTVHTRTDLPVRAHFSYDLCKVLASGVLVMLDVTLYRIILQHLGVNLMPRQMYVPSRRFNHSSKPTHCFDVMKQPS